MLATAPIIRPTPEQREKLVRAGVRDIKGAARFMGISPEAMRQRIRRGEFYTFRVGGKRVVPVVELRRMLAYHAAEDAGESHARV